MANPRVLSCPALSAANNTPPLDRCTASTAATYHIISDGGYDYHHHNPTLKLNKSVSAACRWPTKMLLYSVYYKKSTWIKPIKDVTPDPPATMSTRDAPPFIIVLKDVVWL